VLFVRSIVRFHFISLAVFRQFSQPTVTAVVCHTSVLL
jgi:hypothetical protein